LNLSWAWPPGSTRYPKFFARCASLIIAADRAIEKFIVPRFSISFIYGCRDIRKVAPSPRPFAKREVWRVYDLPRIIPSSWGGFASPNLSTAKPMSVKAAQEIVHMLGE
jgi:hypothetical protein